MRGWIRFLLAEILLLAPVSLAEQWDWVLRGGSTATSVAHDAAANVYVAGTFAGSASLGAAPLTSPHGENVFLAKLSPVGEVQWTFTAVGELQNIVATEDGAVLLCGNLSFPPQSTTTTNEVSIARIENGDAVWLQSFPGTAGGVALGPDQTLSVLSMTDRMFVRRYSEHGDLLADFAVDDPPSAPWKSLGAISVGLNGETYVSGRAGESWGGRYEDMVARVDGTNTLWRWTAGITESYSYRTHLTDIVAHPAGGVVAVGYRTTGLPSATAFIKRLSADGSNLWSTLKYPISKQHFLAHAVTVDRSHYIHVTGQVWGYQPDYVWVFTLGTQGEWVSQEFIRRYNIGPYGENSGLAISADSDGALFVAGQISGNPVFGTNTLDRAPLGGFVGRRSTILPELIREQIGTNLVLSWPTTAAPFVLQQSDSTGTNWSSVSAVPQQIGWRQHVILPLAGADLSFRLLRTNDPPITHAPRLIVSPPHGTFLDHTNMAVTQRDGSFMLKLRAVAEDLDENRLTIQWRDAKTNSDITNNVSTTWQNGRDDFYGHYPSFYSSTYVINSDTSLPGVHTVSVRVSDGVYPEAVATITFEILPFDVAMLECEEALKVLPTTRPHRINDRFALAVRALERGNVSRAARHLRHAQWQLARDQGVSESDRNRWNAAANVLETILRSELTARK